jgi:myo-inositol-1(or 4)-monophosphatase
VREAGGFVSDITGGDKIFETRDIVAGNDYIHKELVKILGPIGK